MPEELRTIRTLSLWQPWATLWVTGRKKIETRSWAPYCRPPFTLAVHAAKRFDKDVRDLCKREPFRSTLADLGYEDPATLPFGAILGVVGVSRVFKFVSSDDLPPEPERSFGNYQLGRYGWDTDERRQLIEPIPAVGLQKLFGWMPTGPLVFWDGIVLPVKPKPVSDPQLNLFA